MSRLFAAVLQHRREAGVTFLVTLALTIVVTLVAPRKYCSEAKLFVRLGRETVSLDPTATTGSTISVYESRENEINSVRDLLQSRAILEQIVDTLGAEIVLGKKSLNSSPAPSAVSASNKNRDSQRERAIVELEKSINVWSNRKSSVLAVRSESSSPALAQRILEEFLQAYDDLHIAANRTPGGHEFFVSQASLLQQRMESALAKLRQAKDEFGIISIEAERENLKQQMNAVVLATLDIQREGLHELKIRESELLSNRTDMHPTVIAIRQQIAESKEVFDEARPRGGKFKTDLYPAGDAHINLANTQSRTMGLEAALQSLYRQKQELGRQLIELNAAEVRIQQLEQEVQLAKANYGQYVENLEQARIDDALQTERITNVNVVQPPTFVSKPVSASRQLILAIGLFAALAGGILTALVLDTGRLPMWRTLTMPVQEMRQAINGLHRNGVNGNGVNGNGANGNAVSSSGTREMAH